MGPARWGEPRFVRLLRAVLLGALLAGCGHAPATVSATGSVASTASGPVRYTLDVQPITSSDACVGCHVRGKAPHIGLGTYAGDSTANTAYLCSMLVQYGELTPEQTVRLDAWIRAGRPFDPGATLSLPAGTPSASPTTGPNGIVPVLVPAMAFDYQQAIQPLTSSENCGACHATGNAPRLNLGTYVFDSTCNADRLRSMLDKYGQLTASQLATLDAWIQAGRPQKVSQAQAPLPSGSAGAGSQPQPQPSPTAKPVFSSPHIVGWKYVHGMLVKLEGGYQSAHISDGGACTNCHTAVKLPNGTIPDSPGSDVTCFSCHNGPTGGH